jgi:hypothetical protein
LHQVLDLFERDKAKSLLLDFFIIINLNNISMGVKVNAVIVLDRSELLVG